ncbi:MAG: undecaprenyl-phosphate galactose phosphotransferase WbaP [Bryobacteraceae bacterium]|jgi:Undecaprenyl-phosphate galactose phosphotransferase WbaP
MATALTMRAALAVERPRPCLTGALLVLSDVGAIAFAIAAAVLIRLALSGVYDPNLYWRLWPLLGLFTAAYALFGLYPGVAMNPVMELRTTSYATTLVFLVLGALTFLLRNPGVYSRLAFFGAWVMALAAVPLARAMVRSIASREPWWGYRAVILGGSGTGAEVLRKLVSQPEIGLRPVAIFDDELPRGSVVDGVPVLGAIEAAPRFAEESGISRAVVAMPDAEVTKLLSLLDEHAHTFSRVFMVPRFQAVSGIGMETRDVSRLLALELRRHLLMTGPRMVKRTLDLLLSSFLLVALAPLLAAIAAAIRLESRGPALYRQSRVGLGSGSFLVWKFRSMRADADRALSLYLAENPELGQEWERDQKLKNDPRITRVGRFLRKTSLDELPQLFNVLRGEMSLVGPRPIVSGEIQKYGRSFTLYRQVIPGLTGLWQVSGRNLTSYQERVELDDYYVRNWSPWLDLYLLARTIKVVVTGYGAY